MKFVDIHENIKEIREVKENVLAKSNDRIDSICK